MGVNCRSTTTSTSRPETQVVLNAWHNISLASHIWRHTEQLGARLVARHCSKHHGNGRKISRIWL